MDVREIGWEGVDWTHVAENRVQWRASVLTGLNGRVLPCNVVSGSCVV
jgi:hypothetical protein